MTRIDIVRSAVVSFYNRGMVTREQIDEAITLLVGIQSSAKTTNVEAIKLLQTTLASNLVLHQHEEVKSLNNQICLLDNQVLKLFAEAMCHEVLRYKPQTERLGYELADISRKYNGDFSRVIFTDEERYLFKKVLNYLDWCSYIFNHTHYDECSNGFFFRRS